MKDIIKNDRKINILPWLGRLSLVFVFWGLCTFYYLKMRDVLNSDIATQLVLSELLNEEKSILSTSWYYASELRLLGYNIFFAPLFSLFSDWNIIRTVGSAVMVLTLEVSIWYFCRQLGISRYFVLLGILFLIPFSYEYFEFVIVYTNYIPFLAISFVSIGLVFHTYRIKEFGKRAALLLLLSLLSLAAGMGGMRQLYITYIPLFLAVVSFVLLKKKKYKIEYFNLFLAAGVALIFAGIGYIINSRYLANKYSFKNYEELAWSDFSVSKLESVIDGILQSLGSPTEGLSVIGVLRWIVSAVLLVLIIYAIIRIVYRQVEASPESIVLAFFMLSAFLMSILVFGCTTMTYAVHYDTLWVVMGFPLLISYFSGNISKEAWKRPVLAAVSAAVVVCSADLFLSYCKENTTSELRNIAEVLEENGYQQGYATFWNANIMTELSDGYLEIWDWGDFSGDFENIDQVHEWAQLKSHASEHPSGKVFWILTKEQEDTFHFTNNLGEEHVIYRSAYKINYYDVLNSKNLETQYVVYVFNSYEEMSALTKYTTDVETRFWNNSDTEAAISSFCIHRMENGLRGHYHGGF